MKKVILIITLFLAYTMGNAQNTCSSWNGILRLHDKEIPLVFNMNMQDGNYVTTMDSPLQKVYGFSTNSTEFKDSVLSIRMDDANMYFKGKMTKSGSIKGEFTQMDRKYPLLLVQTKLNLQTEKKEMPAKYHSYSYYGDSVSFGKNTQAYFTMPIKRGKVAAVVLDASTCGDQAENSTNSKDRIAELSDHLTSNGFAVVCIRSAEGDTQAAVEFLKAQQNIKSGSISVIKMSDMKITAKHLHKQFRVVSNKDFICAKNKISAYNELTSWLIKNV